MYLYLLFCRERERERERETIGLVQLSVDCDDPVGSFCNLEFRLQKGSYQVNIDPDIYHNIVDNGCTQLFTCMG